MQLSAPTQCHILVLSLSPRLMCSDILQHSSISTKLWHRVTPVTRAPTQPWDGGWRALSVAKHCSSLQETTEMSRDFKTPLWPTGHHPLLQLIFYPHSEQRRSPARILQAAQSRAFLYFSPSKLEMRGTPLPFNQTLLLPLQPPAGFCFLPKNSLYHSLPLVKCPIDFSLYVSSSRT